MQTSALGRAGSEEREEDSHAVGIWRAWIDAGGGGRRSLGVQREGWSDGLFEVAGFGRGGTGNEAGHNVVADVSGQHDGWAGSHGEAGRRGRHVVDARAAV